MEIRPVLQPTIQALAPTQGAKAVVADTSSQNNQVFLAQVLKQLPGTNFISVKLLSSLQMLQIENTRNLKPGQLIQLSAVGGELKLQSNPKETADQILRLLLPKQGSVKDALTVLLKSLGLSIQTGVVKREQGSNPEITRLVENIVKQLPQWGEIIKPTVLKKLIQNTGLLSPPPANSNNTQGFQGKTIGQSLLPILKSLLLSNSNQVDTKTQETGARLTELIARVMLSQMRPQNRLEKEEIDTRRAELLARGENQIDSFHIQFSGPKPREEEWDKDSEYRNQSLTERKWTVRLSFDFQELGSITAIIVLSAEKRLEMNFWSERPETLLLINQHRRKFENQLQDKMEAQGIELSMAVFEGRAPQQESAIHSQLIPSLIEEKV